jgi:hypothetical protein
MVFSALGGARVLNGGNGEVGLRGSGLEWVVVLYERTSTVYKYLRLVCTASSLWKDVPHPLTVAGAAVPSAAEPHPPTVGTVPGRAAIEIRLTSREKGTGENWNL